MQITGKHSAPVEKILIPRNKTGGDGQTANVTLAFRVTEDECRSMCGDEFTDGVAFAGMVEREDDDGNTVVAHPIDGKPTKNVVVEMHDVRIFGYLVRGVQPAVNYRGVEREAKVDVLINIPVPIGTSDKADLALVRSGKVGTTHKVEFLPHPKTESLGLQPRLVTDDEQPQPSA